MSHDTTLATKVARAELVKRVLIVVTAAMVAVVLILLLVLISQIRSTQKTGSPVLRAIGAQQDDIKRAADSAAETNERVLDCIDPEGKCFAESQERTAEVITNFNRVVIYAAACASGSEKKTVEQIQACVIDRLALPQS